MIGVSIGPQLRKAVRDVNAVGAVESSSINDTWMGVGGVWVACIVEVGDESGAVELVELCGPAEHATNTAITTMVTAMRTLATEPLNHPSAKRSQRPGSGACLTGHLT